MGDGGGGVCRWGGGGLCMCDDGGLLMGDVVYRFWVGRWVIGGLWVGGSVGDGGGGGCRWVGCACVMVKRDVRDGGYVEWAVRMCVFVR